MHTVPFLESVTFRFTNRESFRPAPPKVHPSGSERPYGRPKRPRSPGGESRWFTLWTRPPNVGVCAGMHGHPPRRGTSRASARVPVAPGGQAGPFGAPRHGPAPGGPCARRFGVRWCSQGCKRGPKGLRTHFLHFPSIHRGCSASCGLSEHPCG